MSLGIRDLDKRIAHCEENAGEKNVAKYFEAIVSGIWIKIVYRKDLPFSRSDPKVLNFVISIQTRQFSPNLC